jgi:hypothetical protein
VRLFSRARWRGSKAKRRPWEPLAKASCTSIIAVVGDFFFELCFGCSGAACEAIVCACGIIVAAARGVRERVVGVVDLLEALGAARALW